MVSVAAKVLYTNILEDHPQRFSAGGWYRISLIDNNLAATSFYHDADAKGGVDKGKDVGEGGC